MSSSISLVHAEDWLLFEKNIGAYICIDEVALSRGELYTVLTNKEAHGGKGSMIAIIKGTDVHTVTSVLLKLSRRRRYLTDLAKFLGWSTSLPLHTATW